MYGNRDAVDCYRTKLNTLRGTRLSHTGSRFEDKKTNSVILVSYRRHQREDDKEEEGERRGGEEDDE